MNHRDDLDLIEMEVKRGIFFEVVYKEIAKRGVDRKQIPPHIHKKLFSEVQEATRNLSKELQSAIFEMTRTGVMKDFP